MVASSELRNTRPISSFIAKTMKRYSPEVFDAADEATARAIILTPEGGTTDDRWARETPYVVARFTALLDVKPGQTLVDFGCGIGRVAKAMIESTGCSVVGIDISPRMREMAREYVASDKFRAVSPEEFDGMRESGWRADSAYACWVLQHCLEPHVELSRIIGALQPGSCIAVLNSLHVQSIPTDRGWSFHDTDMRAMLANFLSETSLEKLPLEIAPADLVESTFLGTYVTHGGGTRQAGLWTRLKNKVLAR